MANIRTLSRTTLRVIATLTFVAVAAALGWFAWQYYVYAPWTRDARVQADIVNVAPEVSGTVTQVAVVDDTRVHKGELLFKIQPVRFKNAVAEAKTTLASARAKQNYQHKNASRLEKLPHGAVSTQSLQQTESQELSAGASVGQAEAQLAQAQQNLEWASVRSPVNGYVTHLQLDQGDYASQGHSVMTLVDTETLRITAYFEETKLARIHVGDKAGITLMAGNIHLAGHVDSISHGIAVSDNAPGEQNLPNVNPTFQWVRLAQRVPVTIAIDQRPRNVSLSVGMTATVHVHPVQEDGADQALSLRAPARVSPQRDHAESKG